METIEPRIGRTSDHAEPLVISLFDVGPDGKPMGSALMTKEFPAEIVSVDGYSALVCPGVKSKRATGSHHRRLVSHSGRAYLVSAGS